MVSTGASNGEPKTHGRNHRKARVNTETSLPKGNKINCVDVTSYLINDTKVKISVSPKEFCNRHLEDSSVVESFIPNTTRVEETAVCQDMEKKLESSDFIERLKAHLITGSRISQGSGGTLSSSDSSQQLKISCKRDHFSNSNNGEPTNSKNGVDIVIPLKRKKKQTGIKSQVYDDVLDITEHLTHNKNEGDLSNSTESSDTSFIKNKAPDHKLKKKKIVVIKKDLFYATSPTVLHQTKQLMKDAQSKSGNINADSEIIKSCDEPKVIESSSSTDSIMNMQPKSLFRKKVSRVRVEKGFESLMATSNNIEPIVEIENKTGYISSGSASSIAPAVVNVRHNFKKKALKRGMFDSAVENPIIEDSVQNIQTNVNDPYTSGQQSKDISIELDAMKAPASAKIVGKINKHHLQHNLFESVVGNEESVEQNVEEQQTDDDLAKNYTQNTLAANVSAELNVLKAPAYPKIVGKINKKHLQHNFSVSVGGNEHENVEGQNGDIAVTKNCAQNTLASNSKESMEISSAHLFAMKVLKKDKCASIPPQTFSLSGIQGHSHNSQSSEGRRHKNDRDHNSSINKLVERKFLPSLIGTSEYNCPILPESGRSTDSPGDSLTTSKFRPKITSSKIYLPKDGIAEKYPSTSDAIQQKVASNTLNITHNEKQIEQSDNPIVCQPKSTDEESDKTNHKKRKKCNSVLDSSLPSSDLTFDPDNVPHSTMVQTSSKKKRPLPDMHKIGNKTRRSLLNSFQDLAEVSMECGENVSVGTDNAGIRITSKGSESENELGIENGINDSGMENCELQPNEHHSHTVEKDAIVANKILVPEKLYVVSDHEQVAASISQNIFEMCKPLSKRSSSDNDVSQVFRHASHKFKSLAKSSSINSQEELINVDSKNEKKQQVNYKNVPDKLKNSAENIVFNEIIKPKSMGCDTKRSVSSPCMGNVSSHSISKPHENSYGNAEIEQISPLDTFAEKLCNSEVGEINPRKSDKESSRAERRKSQSYSFVAVSSHKLSETGVLNIQKGSNLNGKQSNPDNQEQLIVGNGGTEGEGPVIIRQPLKDNVLNTRQKKLDIKQTQAKPTARACFLIDGEQYHKPKLIRPKGWINQRFYKHMLPKFDKEYGLNGSVKCEEFVQSLCDEVTACIRNRKNWDKHVDNVKKLLYKYLLIDTFVDFIVFGEQYLPDEFVFKASLTFEKRCKKK